MKTEVLTGQLTFTSRTPCDLGSCTKDEIREYFENSYALNESVFTAIKDDSSFYLCPDRLRLPLIFYYTHTAVVYINKLILANLLQPSERVDLELETIMETGVDEMSWDDTENYRMGGSYGWPSVQTCVDYRRRVRHLIHDVIARTPLELPVTKDSPWWAMFMGMEHERIHLETSSVLIRQLPVHLVSEPEGWRTAPFRTELGATKNCLIRVDQSTVTLGKPDSFPSYGWDNEYGNVQCSVPGFEASKFMVSNKQMLSFVQDGGYSRRELWTEEGWGWRTFRQASHPAYWVCSRACKSGGGASLKGASHCTLKPSGSEIINESQEHHLEDGEEYRLRLMYRVTKMAPDWPVEVNYHEAKAFCTWQGTGCRLLAEAEHHAIRGKQKPTSSGVESDIIYSDDIPANLNMQYGSSSPVDLYPANELGFHDVMGNAWEWTEDHFNGLPGSQTHPLYDDFSIPTYDGKHNVILGGSWIATGDEASRFARYAFRRHFIQHAGFRVARTIKPNCVKVQEPIRQVNTPVYIIGKGIEPNQTTLDLSEIEVLNVSSTNYQYMHDHDYSVQTMLRFEYGTEVYPKAMSALTVEACQKYEVSCDSVLVLGCNTGRVSLDLSAHFASVLATDYCGRFVNTCQEIQRGKTPPELPSDIAAPLPLTSVSPHARLDRVVFMQLTWLPNEVKTHNLLLFDNIDRVVNAKAWLLRFREIVRMGGVVITSSLTWSPEKLAAVLTPEFELVQQEDVTYPSTQGEERTTSVTVWKRV